MNNSRDDVRLRIGTPLDHRRMMSFLHVMHEEEGVAPLDEESAQNTLACGLARHDAIVGIIDGDNNDIAASIGLFINRIWYSRALHLEDRWVFVAPPYRRRPMARPLMEFAKRAAASLGLPLLMTVLSEERTLAKVRLCERQFSRMRGAIFLHRPEGVAHV